jgi:hypothetical protein
MNAKKLNDLSSKNDTAARILKTVVSRLRNTKYTAFSGLRADLKKRDGAPVDRKDFDGTFTALEKIGAGKLQKTARGTCIGFTWAIPVRDLGVMLSQALPQPISIEENPNPRAAGKVTLVIIRRGQAPQTIEADESVVARFSRPEASA